MPIRLSSAATMKPPGMAGTGRELQRPSDRFWPKRRHCCEACDGAPDPARGPSARRPRDGRAHLPRSRKQLLDRVFGRDRIHGEARAELESGDLTESRVDLPVPVVGRVDLLAEW